jgi:hypothetical protein
VGVDQLVPGKFLPLLDHVDIIASKYDTTSLPVPSQVKCKDFLVDNSLIIKVVNEKARVDAGSRR